MRKFSSFYQPVEPLLRDLSGSRQQESKVRTNMTEPSKSSDASANKIEPNDQAANAKKLCAPKWADGHTDEYGAAQANQNTVLR